MSERGSAGQRECKLRRAGRSMLCDNMRLFMYGDGGLMAVGKSKLGASCVMICYWLCIGRLRSVDQDTELGAAFG